MGIDRKKKKTALQSDAFKPGKQIPQKGKTATEKKQTSNGGSNSLVSNVPVAGNQDARPPKKNEAPLARPPWTQGAKIEGGKNRLGKKREVQSVNRETKNGPQLVRTAANKLGWHCTGRGGNRGKRRLIYNAIW